MKSAVAVIHKVQKLKDKGDFFFKVVESPCYSTKFLWNVPFGIGVFYRDEHSLHDEARGDPWVHKDEHCMVRQGGTLGFIRMNAAW